MAAEIFHERRVQKQAKQKPLAQAKESPKCLPELTSKQFTEACKALSSWINSDSIIGLPRPELPKECRGRTVSVILEAANRMGRVFRYNELQLLLQYHTADGSIIGKYPGEASRLTHERQAINAMMRPASDIGFREAVETYKDLQAKLDRIERGGSR